LLVPHLRASAGFAGNSAFGCGWPRWAIRGNDTRHIVIGDLAASQAPFVRGEYLFSAKGCDMSKINFICLKTMRWSGWLLLPLVMAFLLTGYVMDGRYGFGKLLDEKTALTLHRMFHLPLIVLVLAHVVPAMYLAFQRWGWIKHREKT
jgi:hypothetical protein